MRRSTANRRTSDTTTLRTGGEKLSLAHEHFEKPSAMHVGEDRPVAAGHAGCLTFVLGQRAGLGFEDIGDGDAASEVCRLARQLDRSRHNAAGNLAPAGPGLHPRPVTPPPDGIFEYHNLMVPRLMVPCFCLQKAVRKFDVRLLPRRGFLERIAGGVSLRWRAFKRCQAPKGRQQAGPRCRCCRPFRAVRPMAFGPEAYASGHPLDAPSGRRGNCRTTFCPQKHVLSSCQSRHHHFPRRLVIAHAIVTVRDENLFGPPLRQKLGDSRHELIAAAGKLAVRATQQRHMIGGDAKHARRGKCLACSNLGQCAGAMYLAWERAPSVITTIPTLAPALTLRMIVPPQPSVSSSGCGAKTSAGAARSAALISRTPAHHPRACAYPHSAHASR